MNTIGENIAVLRKQNGLTQEALALAIGVSSQSISKWENNTTMPDIMLLPVIADVFNIPVDLLFGRQDSKRYGNAEEAFDRCCDSMLDTMMSCFHGTHTDDSFEKSLKQYKHLLNTDDKMRTGIIRKHGIVYYRQNIGGLLLKKSKSHWYELFDDVNAIKIVELLSNRDFRRALADILKTQKTIFTMASLCNSCEIENTAALKEAFENSRLFVTKSIEIDGNPILLYELVQGQRLFLLFAVLTYAAEYSGYEDIYTGYHGDGNYYLA